VAWAESAWSTPGRKGSTSNRAGPFQHGYDARSRLSHNIQVVESDPTPCWSRGPAPLRWCGNNLLGPSRWEWAWHNENNGRHNLGHISCSGQLECHGTETVSSVVDRICLILREFSLQYCSCADSERGWQIENHVWYQPSIPDWQIHIPSRAEL
jgi:hypothetical protein